MGQTRRLICLGMSASPPTPDVSLRRSEPTLWARRDDFQHIPNEFVSAVAGGLSSRLRLRAARP